VAEPSRTASGANLRASDADRDRVATELGRHWAEGRLAIDELERRLERLYAAETVAEVRGLLADLPRERVRDAAAAVGRHGPGIRPFSHCIDLGAKPETVKGAILAKLSPGFHRYGYEVRKVSEGMIVYERHRRPGWVPFVAVLAFPVGLLALAVREKHRIVVSLEQHGRGRTLLTVHGTAPRGIRKAFAELVADA